MGGVWGSECGCGSAREVSASKVVAGVGGGRRERWRLDGIWDTDVMYEG